MSYVLNKVILVIVREFIVDAVDSLSTCCRRDPVMAVDVSYYRYNEWRENWTDCFQRQYQCTADWHWP